MYPSALALLTSCIHPGLLFLPERLHTEKESAQRRQEICIFSLLCTKYDLRVGKNKNKKGSAFDRPTSFGPRTQDPPFCLTLNCPAYHCTILFVSEMVGPKWLLKGREWMFRTCMNYIEFGNRRWGEKSRFFMTGHAALRVGLWGSSWWQASSTRDPV